MSLLAVNNYTNEYLEGKDLESVSQDYRYWYYTEGEALTDALDEMPNWMLILKIPLWA
jgi:hypothetical protein